MDACRSSFLFLLAGMALVLFLVAGSFTPSAAGDEDESHPLDRLVTALEKVEVGLADAVGLAEARSKGTALAAQLEIEGDELAFEVIVLVRGDVTKVVEVKIDAMTGVVLEMEVEYAEGGESGATDEEDDDDEDDDEEDDDEEDEGERIAPGSGDASKTRGAFTDRFLVEPEDLGPTGRNPFFVLEPGHYLVLERRGEKVMRLTVTVLDETRVVDGVETRVVEELETVDGKVVERSRNYFAISKRTNDVFYFGEDAGGAWEAGKDGARYGLLMPGSPLLGARYCQEIAPGVAMDRAEIVGLASDIETPAGRFRNCLRVLETSPLESGEVAYKLYAPGIGLIYDEGMRLIEHGWR